VRYTNISRGKTTFSKKATLVDRKHLYGLYMSLRSAKLYDCENGSSSRARRASVLSCSQVHAIAMMQFYKSPPHCFSLPRNLLQQLLSTLFPRLSRCAVTHRSNEIISPLVAPCRVVSLPSAASLAIYVFVSIANSCRS